MEYGQTPFRSAPHPPFWPTKRERAAYICSLLIALALPFWDAFHNRSPDTHPLQTDRLCLRLVGIFFMVVNFAIFGAVAFRLGRLTIRRRKGQCLKCGYDLRETSDRCPECGIAFQRSDPASSVPLTRWQARVLKVLSACDSGWFYLANTVGFGLAALIIHDLWSRIVMGCIALWDLCCMIRRIRKGPTDFARMLQNNSR